jgi:hypothetical protein
MMVGLPWRQSLTKKGQVRPTLFDFLSGREIANSPVVSIVNNTNNALVGTSLAVTFTGDEKNRVLYLYYVNQSKQLTRTVGTWSGNT